jgi:hypothetical protein
MKPAHKIAIRIVIVNITLVMSALMRGGVFLDFSGAYGLSSESLYIYTDNGSRAKYNPAPKQIYFMGNNIPLQKTQDFHAFTSSGQRMIALSDVIIYILEDPKCIHAIPKINPVHFTDGLSQIITGGRVLPADARQYPKQEEMTKIGGWNEKLKLTPNGYELRFVLSLADNPTFIWITIDSEKIVSLKLWDFFEGKMSLLTITSPSK